MVAEIISIGDELLIGQVVNTNAAWMAEVLTGSGIAVRQITTVSDQGKDILEALESAAKRATIILITGGLGPTRDDLTKQTLCTYFNTQLVFHEPVFEHIQELFRQRSLAWNKLNRQQAYLPESCTVLPNQHGTAPGMWFEKEGNIYISLPGVPFEMKPLMTDYVIPGLTKHFPKLQSLVHRTVYTQGIPESVLAVRIEDWEDQLPDNIKLAYLPRPGMVRLRLSASNGSKKDLENAIERELEKLHAVLPGEIFGGDEENLEMVIGRLLKAKDQTLSTAESCTGGYIAHRITSVPGSSVYFIGSVVAYANEVKQRMLGVDPALLEQHGAVSEPVVRAMASGVKERFGTSFSIAVSGIAGPDGGTTEKPVGTTWIAVGTPREIHSRHFVFGDHRERNIQRAAHFALNMLRKALIS